MTYFWLMKFEKNCILPLAWWRHQMETFSALVALCAGNSPVTGEFPSQRAVTRSFDVFFDLRLNKRLSKQSWGWWFETPSRPLWRRFNGNVTNTISQRIYPINRYQHLIASKETNVRHETCINMTRRKIMVHITKKDKYHLLLRLFFSNYQWWQLGLRVHAPSTLSGAQPGIFRGK